MANLQPGSDCNFEKSVMDAFSFLQAEGFEVRERCPTLVGYGRKGIEVDVYHGRQSFEVGLGVRIGGERFSLSELIRLRDPAFADIYGNPVASKADEIVSAVSELALMFRRFGELALLEDENTFAALMIQRRQWSEALALDVLAAKIRPLAETAFRSGDYSKAFELYSSIRSVLSPAERQKLALAERRASTRH